MIDFNSISVDTTINAQPRQQLGLTMKERT
jgi:hypothetical protein